MRCYCNLPACITTGYMCKSAGRGCFSDLVDHVDVYRARHGCLDLLDSDRQQQCKNQPRPPSDPDADDDVDDVPAWEQDAAAPHLQQQEDAVAVAAAAQDVAAAPARQDAVKARTPQDTPSLLLCCKDDMCNHIDSPDSRMRHSGKFEGGVFEEVGLDAGRRGAAPSPASGIVITPRSRLHRRGARRRGNGRGAGEGRGRRPAGPRRRLVLGRAGDCGGAAAPFWPQRAKNRPGRGGMV